MKKKSENDRAFLESEMQKRIDKLVAELKEAGKGFEAQRQVLEQKRADMEADYLKQIAELKATH